MLGDLVQETVALRGDDLEIMRPRDAEALVDERAFAEEDEFLPYWAELWPAASGSRGRWTAGPCAACPCSSWAVDWGCRASSPPGPVARVLATDWSAAALELLHDNAARNDVVLETMRADWTRPDELLARGPFPLVLAADVLYERRNIPVLLDLLPQLVASAGEIWLADPGRATADVFLALADAEGWQHRATSDRDRPNVVVHRFTP